MNFHPRELAIVAKALSPYNGIASLFVMGCFPVDPQFDAASSFLINFAAATIGSICGAFAGTGRKSIGKFLGIGGVVSLLAALFLLPDQPDFSFLQATQGLCSMVLGATVGIFADKILVVIELTVPQKNTETVVRKSSRSVKSIKRKPVPPKLKPQLVHLCKLGKVCFTGFGMWLFSCH